MTAALTNKFLRDQWAKAIQACTQLPEDRVIWETWSDRRPIPGSYMTLYLVERQFHQSNIPAYEWKDNVYREILINSVEDTLRISAIGVDALDLITRTASQLSSADRWFDLWPYIGKGNQGTIRDTSVDWQGEFHQRYQMDLQYYAALIAPSRRANGSDEFDYVESVDADIIFYTVDKEKHERSITVKPGG